MATITCSRCNEAKEQLPKQPVGGTLGETILERVCSDCWQEWTATSARIINHYGLNLGHADHRQQLREAMKEFLNLAGSERAG